MVKPTKHYGGWRIRWRDVDGRRHSEVWDKFRDAEEALHHHQADADDARRRRSLGQPDPQAVRTFNDLADNWLATRALEKRSGSDDESMLRVHLRPPLGAMPLPEIAADRVLPLVFRIQHGPRRGQPVNEKTRHNLLTLLIALLNHAHEIGWLEKVPKIRKPRIHVAEDDYAFLRTTAEVRRFLSAARDQGDDVLALYSTALHTGMRAGELAGLRWGDVDFGTRLITVARSYTGPTKSGRIRRVPIDDELLELLRAWRLRVPGELVFPNREGRMLGPSARIFQEIYKRVVRAAGLEVDAPGREHLVFHSLRHSFASHWVMRGGDLYRLQKVGGWRSFQMVQRYAHLAADAFQGDHGRLVFAVPDAPAEVVALPRRLDLQA